MRHRQPVRHIKVGLDFGSSSIPVGNLALRDQQIYFEYESEFIRQGLPLSPIRLPLRPGVKTFSTETFEGLPGVFNDSLPDGWGRLLLDRAMRRHGILPEILTPLDRLASVGKFGMGALTYEPDHSGTLEETELTLDWIAHQSMTVLEGDAEDVLDELLALSGSSAGARPKALIGFNDATGRILYGNMELPDGYETWLVKFINSRDGSDAGVMEFIYSELARHAGLLIPDTQLFPAKQGFGYFGVKRFDRNKGKRFHVHTPCGLLHSDHRIPSLDYRDLLELTIHLTQDVRELESMFRLAVFNVLAHNRDDHSKNFSFLMNETGEWYLAPAYDLTFSFGPGGEQSTMVMGEGKSPTVEHLRKLGEHADISSSKVKEIIERTQDALAKWTELSKNHDLREATRDLVRSHIHQ